MEYSEVFMYGWDSVAVENYFKLFYLRSFKNICCGVNEVILKLNFNEICDEFDVNVNLKK